MLFVKIWSKRIMSFKHFALTYYGCWIRVNYCYLSIVQTFSTNVYEICLNSKPSSCSTRCYVSKSLQIMISLTLVRWRKILFEFLWSRNKKTCPLKFNIQMRQIFLFVLPYIAIYTLFDRKVANVQIRCKYHLNVEFLLTFFLVNSWS